MPALATNKVSPPPVPATVVYKFDAGPWQVASTANGFSNWSATLPAPSLGVHGFAAYAVDDQGNVTANLLTSYYYVNWAHITLIQNGNGSVIGTSKSADGKVSETFGTVAPGSVNADLCMSGIYNLTMLAGPGYLLSNLVVTADYGVSNNLPCPAKYKLVADTVRTNMTVTVDFVPDRFLQCSTGTYWGLYYTVTNDPIAEVTNAQFESSGLIELAVKAGDQKTGKQVASGAVVVEGEKVSFTMNLDLNGSGTTFGEAKQPTRKKGGSTDVLTVTANFDLAGGQVVTGTVSNQTTGNWSSTFTAYRSPYGDPSKGILLGPSPASGTYTMAIGNSSDPTEPGGYGYGTAILGLKGVATKGLYGDTEALQPFAPNVSTNGVWPYYQALYKTTDGAFHGSVIGWLTFTNGSIDGSLTWVKKLATGLTLKSTTYTGGFTNTFQIQASSWTNNGSQACFTTFSLGQVVTSGGYLTTLGTNTITQIWTNGAPFLLNVPAFGPNKVVAAGKPGGYTNNLNVVKMTLSPVTGVVKGSFYDNVNKLNAFQFQGVILENQDTAYGLQWTKSGAGFPAINTGPVTIEAAP